MKTELTADVHKLLNFSNEQMRIMSVEIIPLLVSVVNSPHFKEKVLNYSYRHYFRTWYGSKRYYTIDNFKKNKSYTRETIFNRFMSGVDKFGEADSDIDLSLSLYFSSANVIGYVYPSKPVIYINKKYFDYRIKDREKGHPKIIGNIIHEKMHQLNFDHDYKWNPTRKHTVPYAYGYIAEEVAKLF